MTLDSRVAVVDTGEVKAAIPTLVRFSRLAAEASAASEILPLLAGAAVDLARADAAFVAQVLDDGTVAVTATKNLDDSLVAAPAPPDVLGAELATWALAATGGRFADAHVCMMISKGDLFGALVLLFPRRGEADPERLEVAEALVDLAATALAKNAQFDSLKRAHEELRAAQATLVRSEKLRALGQMAAGISHDLRNVLNPLWLHLQVIERAGKKHKIPEVVESATEMRQVLTRGLETVERLRDYARQGPESLAESVDLNAVVTEAAEIAKSRIASRPTRAAIKLKKALGASRPVLGRSADVVNAVVNLVVNAIDALEAGGTITLATGADERGSWIEVADDGPGMPPEVEQHIFEPFFTTKGDEGTGLGLAMVFACMQRHGGSVNLETSPGKGARFRLDFAPGQRP